MAGESIMKFTLPALPYKTVPGFSAKIFEYHHGKHHAAYVKNLNKLIEGTTYEKIDLEEIVKHSSGKIFNNASQHWNHSFYWKCMTPKKTEISDELKNSIEKKFKSVDSFKEEFIKKAGDIFGSGWCALVDVEGDLVIKQYHNADNSVKSGGKCLLLVDTWEHAMYIDYPADKKGYLNAFWKVINWDFVSQIYNKE